MAKIFAERIPRSEDSTNTKLGDSLKLRVEQTDIAKLKVDQLKSQTLKIAKLGAPIPYTDAVRNDKLLELTITQAQDDLEGKVIDVQPYFQTAESQSSYHDCELELVEYIPLKVPLDQDIQKGDPDKHGLYLTVKEMIKQADGVLLSEIEAWAAVNNMAWQGEFGAKEAENQTFSTKYSLDIYFSILKNSYSGKNSLSDILLEKTEKILQQNSEFLVGSSYMKIYLSPIHECLRKAHALTKKEAEYFILSMQQKNADFLLELDSMDLRGLRFTLSLLATHLYNFNDNKVEILTFFKGKESTLLEDYAKDEDPEEREELQKMSVGIEGLNPKLLQNYLDNYTGTLWGGGDDKEALQENMEGTELQIEDVDKFLEMFKMQALGKAFELLRQNEQIVEQELAAYTDSKRLDALVKVIQGEKKPIKHAQGKLVELLKNASKLLNQAGYDRYGQLNLDVFLPLMEKTKGLKFSGHEISKYTTDPEAQKKLLLDPELQTDFFAFIKILLQLLQSKGWQRNILYRRRGIGWFTSEKEDNKHYNKLSKEIQDLENQSQQLQQTAFTPYQQSVEAIYAEGDKYPILKDPTFNFGSLSSKPANAIKEEIIEKLQEKLVNAEAVVEHLNDDPDKVWELLPLLGMTMSEMEMLPKSNTEKIIADKIKDVERNKMFTSLFIGAVSLALAVGGLFTGGVTTALGMTLIASSAALSITDFMIEYDRYSFGSAVADTAIEDKDELGDVEVHLWALVLAGAGIFLDALDAVKAIKYLKNIRQIKNINNIDAAQSLAKLADKDAGKLYEELIAAGYDLKMTKELFAKNFQKGLKKLGQELDPTFVKFLKENPIGQKIDLLAQPGLNNLYKRLGKESLENLFQANRLNPFALNRIGELMTVEPNLAKGLATLMNKLSAEPDSLSRIVNAYGSSHLKHFGDLPDLLKRLERGKLFAQPKLVEQLLLNPRLQALVLESEENLLTIAGRWDNWIKGGHKSKSFVEFVQTGTKAVSLKGNKHLTIVEYFASNKAMKALFSAKGKNLEKNLALLKESGLDLSRLLSEQGTEFLKLKKALNEVLAKDLILTTTNFAYAKGKVIKAVNQAIGSHTSIKQLRRLLKEGIPELPVSVGSVFETWVRKNAAKLWKGNKLLGKLNFPAKELKKMGEFRDFDGTRIVIDEHYKIGADIVAVEVKAAEKLGVQGVKQARNYALLMKVRAIQEMEYVFLSQKAAKAEKGRLTEIFYKSSGNIRIYFINEAGNKTLL